MKSLTKKRTKAIFIDFAISSIVTVGVEQLLRKKIKSEFVHAVITPSAVMWGLEYLQLRKCGQTIGYKAMGLKLESSGGSELSSQQIAKRFLYRDTKSTLDYLKNREGFEGQEGAVYPHDAYAGTTVKEIKPSN
ncbi:RDD family protein [Jeotgalibacillus proteolyticus]|uniref:RDD family protein n=1 Tax=Jeotgalibacillus proteolyticus TaxID=2082395 RepID=A0A2S5GDE8_9BACL|nr:RDD family protein [Jeotgalibacillus proteolyticus]PPA71030.1 RDD family protein [Jeotgalibacillus proteolyticus]